MQKTLSFSSRLTLLLSLFCCLICTGIASATSEIPSVTIQDQYKQAKFYYNQILSTPSLQGKRNIWIKCGSNFRKVYLDNQKSELAPASLFMLGDVYRHMYEKFANPEDIADAIGYYQDCQQLFPHHRLADDALFKLADIALHEKKDPEEAAQYYNQIISDYPSGDMQSQAIEGLKLLSSEFNIALPSSLLNTAHPTKVVNILPAKYWSSRDYSRVIIQASEPVTYSAQLLEKNANLPRRLFVDFQNSYINPNNRAPIPVTDGLLQQIRSGQNTPDTVRIVLDLGSISSYKIFSLPDPFRVVIDIRGEKAAEHEAISEKQLNTIADVKVDKSPVVILKESSKKRLTTKNQKIVITKKKEKEKEAIAGVEETEKEAIPELQNQQEFTLAQQLGLGAKKIVIDPGHGGKDPGAMAFGLKEKDIVLHLGKILATELRKKYGFEVILTRKDDRFISLEERTAIANGNNADLFISLHLNAHRVKSVHGTETYYLNLSNNPEAMRVAAYENATSELQMSDLQDVLANIMKNSKIQESSRFAHSVHATLVKSLQEDNFSLKDLGVKQAPFYVLIGAEMPAILIELAFISNKEDAKKLQNDTFLLDSAHSIGQGINHYIHSNLARLN